MNKAVSFRRVTVALACALGVPLTHGAAWDWNNSTAVWTAAGAWTPDEFPLSAMDTLLRFGGTGTTSYVSTYDFAAPFLLNALELNSTATVTETISTSIGGTLSFVTNGSTNPQLTQKGSGAFDITLGLDAANPLTLGGAGSGLVTLSGVITGAVD